MSNELPRIDEALRLKAMLTIQEKTNNHAVRVRNKIRHAEHGLSSAYRCRSRQATIDSKIKELSEAYDKALIIEMELADYDRGQY